MVATQGHVVPIDHRTARHRPHRHTARPGKTVSEDFSINIRQINIQTHDNIFEGTISLYVKDAEGLHAIMDKIRKIKGIDTVKRNQD